MSDPITKAYKELFKTLVLANVKIRNDAIEECAKLCDDARADELADAIRALKEKNDFDKREGSHND